jgi:carboxypeptidase PM20D1
MKKFFLGMVAVVCALGVALIARAVRFSSRQIAPPPAATFTFDRDGALRRLAKAIQFRTVSSTESLAASAPEFEHLHRFLAGAFPRIHQRLKKEIVGGRSLIYEWKGSDDQLRPALLMAHMDVVPVDPATEPSWRHPPFAGEIAGGFIWGRGAMDDKASLMGMLEAAEQLLAVGFQPRRTFLFAFGHDEEVGGGNGAAKIAALLGSRKIELEFVLDEGSNILNGIIPGLARPVALVGIAEKGYLSLKLSAQAPGGHSSMPPDDAAIFTLSRALQKLAASPFAPRIAGATGRMLEFLGPEMAWTQRIALANLWLFEPLVVRQLASSPITNAAIRTTIAPTIFTAGVQENVLPTAASAVINLRILPGDTIASATRQVRKTIADPRLTITPLPLRMEPSAVSDTDAATFKLLQRTIRQIAPDAIVAPGLLVAATDSRHYAGLSKNIYRFLPLVIGPADAERYHGIDERISIEDYERLIRFYAQIIRNFS